MCGAAVNPMYLVGEKWAVLKVFMGFEVFSTVKWFYSKWVDVEYSVKKVGEETGDTPKKQSTALHMYW